jgi:hypothetical protein
MSDKHILGSTINVISRWGLRVALLHKQYTITNSTFHSDRLVQQQHYRIL